MGLSAWLLEVCRCEEGRAAAVATDARPARYRVFPLLKVMVEAGEIFHPLEPTKGAAIPEGRSVPALESAGGRHADAGELAHEPPPHARR